jgi:ribonucleoside-diphosphate reductase alpha chain
MNPLYSVQIDYTKDSLFDELGIKRLRESYMREDEKSPQDRLAFVSSAFASNQEHAQRLYDYASKHWLSYSTPILSFGKGKQGLPISCYLNWLADTSAGLIDNLSETNWLSMLGGGVGIHVGIRGADEKSVGVMPHMKTYDASVMAYKQGTRRGSYAAYLDISHPDIIQFLEMRKPTGDQNMRTLNMNHGVNIPDRFMEIIEKCMVDSTADDSWELVQPHNGEVKEVVSAKALWVKLLEMRVQTGEPYIWFIDAANRGVPEFQKKLGLKNRGSNLCVAPETLILTDCGHKKISSLVDSEVNVWNGKEFSCVTVKKTGTNQKLVTVKTNSGAELTCTPYHKFYVIDDSDSTNRRIIMKSASELKFGDRLEKCNFQVISGNEVLENAYANGFYSGDGCEVKNKGRIYLYGEKKLVKPYLGDIFGKWIVQEEQNREYAHSTELRKKFFVPEFEHSVESKLEWFAGLCDSDGTVANNGKTQSIQISSINKEFLVEVQLMLQTLGVNSKVTKAKDSGINKLPKNDGSGELGEYFTKEVSRLLIGNTGIVKLLSLGFVTHRLILTTHTPNRDATQFVKIVEVEDSGRIDDTYCFTEPKRGRGVFNGILTGQCSEISLVTSEDRTAVCCLSSVNLEYYDDWKADKNFLPDILEMLDNVIQYFIDHAPDTISRAKYSAMRERSVGVGALGWHAFLQKNGLPFEGVMAKSLNNRIFSHIRKELDVANENLAKLRGACPDAAESGVLKRCSHVMAVAPNASSSIIMGNTSPSIEPYAANAYRQDTTSGAYLTKNKFLDEIILREAKNHPESWYDDQWASIIAHNGSVQHLEWLSDLNKEVFKTFMEIDQRWVVDQTCDRQKYVDQAISTNLSFAPDANVKYLHAVHFMAWKGGAKSLYYVRSKKLKSADKVGQKIELKRIEDEINMAELANGETCLACEG